MSNDNDDVDMLKDQLEEARIRRKESRASCFRNHYMAYNEVKKASMENKMASGVLLTLNSIGGSEIISVLIQDGLSNETIECIRKDIKRSQEVQSSFTIIPK